MDTISELRCADEGNYITVPAKPHRVVQLTLKRRFQPLLLTTLKMPKPFPRRKPIGCARPPAELDRCASAGSILAERDRDTAAILVSDRWASTVAAIEEELCGICDFVGQAHRGRAEGTSLALRQVLPRRAAGRHGNMGQAEFAVVWGVNRLKELLELSEIHETRGALSEGQRRQWDRLVRKMCSPSAPVFCAEGRWEDTLEALQEHRWQPCGARNALRIAHNWAMALVSRQAKIRANRRNASWQEWKRRQCEAGGAEGALFNFLKRTEQDPEIVVRCGGVRSASPQAVLQQDFLLWNGLWQKLAHLGGKPWRALPREMEPSEDLPPLGHNELRKAARTFRTTTAAGADGLVPSQFGWLSDNLLDEIGKFFKVCEVSGCWPSQTALALIHLIPKSAGGRRPIGVLAALVRLWERARKPVVDDWKRTCSRQYDWMATGKGAERSVWAQALYEEAAAADGKATASVYIDLVKAFEQVLLAHVWDRGRAHGMPLQILVLALEACVFTRRLTYCGAVSEPAETSTAILAGSGRATDLLLVALVDSVDGLLREHEHRAARTTLRCFMIVDDVKLVVEGVEEDVAEQLPKIARKAVRVLEEDLHMCVSRDDGQTIGKTVAQASSHKLGNRVRTKLKSLGIRVVSNVKNLGVQFAAGGRRGFVNQVAAQRYRDGLKKLNRARTIGRKARRKAVNSLLTPSFTFGSSAVSCPGALVRQLRTQSANAIGPAAGRSTSTRLLLEGMDAAEVLATKAVMAWVNGLWDRLVEPSVMQRAWQFACACNLTEGRRARGSVSGAAAYLDSVDKLGWTTPSFDSLKTMQGIILFFGAGTAPAGTYAADPTLVRKFVADEYEYRVMASSTVGRDLADLSGLRGYPWSEMQATAALRTLNEGDGSQRSLSSTGGSTADEERRRAADIWRRGRFDHGNDGPVPWLWPIKVTMKAARRAGLHSAAASIRALAEGGWPTQFRLKCHRHAKHAWCSCEQAVGTLKHKLGQCRLSESLRQRHCPDWLLKCCEREAWNPLFSRGVPARPRAAPLPKEVQWEEKQDRDSRCAATGDIYTDGSAVGAYWRARRGGWAVVALDSQGKWRWTKFGAIGGPNVSSHRAELRAIHEALKVAEPPLRIHTDNQPVVDGCRHGRAWCTSSRAADADLWRTVWDLLEESRAKGTVDIVKVKAHTGWAELLLRKISPRDQYGNWLADEAAKEGAARSEKEAPAAPFRAQLHKALSWLRWIGRYATEWVNDIEFDPSLKVPATRRDAASCAFDLGGAYMKHELWQIGRRETCRRCLSSQPLGTEESRFSAERCPGAAAGRAAAQATGNINYVWSHYALPRADLVSRGGRLTTHGRPPKWMVDRGRLEAVAENPQHLAELRSYLNGACTGGLSSPWLAPPQWMPAHLVQPWEVGGVALRREAGCFREDLEERSSAHRVAFSGPLAYCLRCACFAEKRVGSRFKGDCTLPEGRVAVAVRYRLARLSQGKHPITGEALA